MLLNSHNFFLSLNLLGSILDLMESSLLMGNNLGNSPLHLCCQLLESGSTHPSFLVQCIFAVLFYVKENFKSK